MNEISSKEITNSVLTKYFRKFSDLNLQGHYDFNQVGESTIKNYDEI